MEKKNKQTSKKNYR